MCFVKCVAFKPTREVLMDAISGICRYYVDDEEVVADNELQELVNELSADGKQGDFGGLGMVRRSIESSSYYFIYHKRSLYI